MTAIIAIKDGKQIIVGADGISSGRDYSWPIEHPQQYKIQRVNGSPCCIMACAGSCDGANLIKKIPNLLNGKDDVNYKYMVNKVVPKIFKYLGDAHLLKVKDEYNIIDNTILITTKNHIFHINEHGYVTEANKVMVMGSGADLLISKYRHIKNQNISVEDKVIECLKHCIKYGQKFGYPITLLLNNKTNEIKVIESKE